jgi:hypothetical protein
MINRLFVFLALFFSVKSEIQDLFKKAQIRQVAARRAIIQRRRAPFPSPVVTVQAVTWVVPTTVKIIPTQGASKLPEECKNRVEEFARALDSGMSIGEARKFLGI